MPRPAPRQNLNIDTSGYVPVTNALPRMAISPPIELQPARSPFLIGSLPTTSTANPDSIRNFNTPGIPSYRITPPPPITQSSGAANVTAPVKTVPKLLQPTPAPTISQFLITIPTGYQFSFLQVRLPLQDTVAIASYKIYRSTANNSASATVIQSVIHHQANVGIPVIIQDNQPNGVTQFYWVSAVNNGGQESSLVPAQSASVKSNAGFSATSQLASSFHGLPTNTTFTGVSPTSLANDGSSTSIVVAAETLVFGSGLVNYNSASSDPGGFGTWYVFTLDPLFQGGAAFTFASFSPISQVTSDGTLSLGKIITSSTVITTGGGLTGGTTAAASPPIGGAGGRGIVL